MCPSDQSEPLRQFELTKRFRIAVTQNRAVLQDGCSATQRETVVVLPFQEVNQAAISADGRVFVVSDTTHILVYRHESSGYVLRREIPFELKAQVSSLSLSMDGRRLAVQYSYAEEFARVWDVEKGIDLSPASLRDFSNQILATRFSPGGRLLVLNNGVDETSMIDVVGRPEAKITLLLDHTRVVSMDFSSDDRYLGLGSDEGALHIFDLGAANSVAQIARLQQVGEVRRAVFSRNSRYVAVETDRARTSGEGANRFELAIWPLQSSDLMAEAKKRSCVIVAHADRSQCRTPTDWDAAFRSF